MRFITILVFASLGATLTTACTRDVQAYDAQQIEERYGVSGAYADTINTTDGPIKGTLVPITLADGSQGHLFIPQKAANAPEAVYVMDQQGLHPVRLGDNVSRTDVTRAPAIVERRPAVERAKPRSWEKEVLIIGGSAGAGTGIGALAGGKKGAGVGAAAGGVGGLIYDLATRNKK
jgi:hypothetical protein